jgi:SAM-dependent methyltransferase
VRQPHEPIVRFYEACLAQHGDTHMGVGWPKAPDAETRYRIMLDVLRRDHGGVVEVLDFGCGASHLYDHIRRTGRHDIAYSGLDASEKFIALSRSKHPSVPYLLVDVLSHTGELPSYDYVVLNGVLTVKRELPFDQMLEYAGRLLARVFSMARIGMAFNVMSTHVEWRRDDLFHVPEDVLGRLLTERVSRHFVMRHDYGLYEYTTYVYRTPA